MGAFLFDVLSTLVIGDGDGGGGSGVGSVRSVGSVGSVALGCRVHGEDEVRGEREL